MTLMFYDALWRFITIHKPEDMISRSSTTTFNGLVVVKLEISDDKQDKVPLARLLVHGEP